MHWLLFLFLCGLLSTLIISKPINDNVHLDHFKYKLWPTDRTLIWKLNHHGFEYDSTKIRQDIQQAFDDWARCSPLSFREGIEDEKADFHLAFVSGDHSDGTPFDGASGRISHSFPPDHYYAGHIHFDSSKNWTHTYDPMGYNLRLVAAHEIGSSLGLLHSNDSRSIMSPFYQGMVLNETLPEQDQVNIQKLYGKKTNLIMNTHSYRIVRSVKTKQRKQMKKLKKMMKMRNIKKLKKMMKMRNIKKLKKMMKMRKMKKLKKIIGKMMKKIKKNRMDSTKKGGKAKTQGVKNFEKSERNRRKKKKMTKTTTTTTTAATTTTTTAELVTFSIQDIKMVDNKLKSPKHMIDFRKFEQISEIILNTTGALPPTLIPYLQELATLNSETTMTFRTKLAELCALLTNFVIKSYRVMQRGMNAEDKAIINNFKVQLDKGMVDTLKDFVNSSRSSLNDIYLKLLNHSVGENAKTLLNKKASLEEKISNAYKNLTTIEAELGDVKGNIELISFRIQILNQSIDREAMKKQIDQEIKDLKAKIPDYEKEILQHRSIQKEVQVSFLFFWKVREVVVVNGENLAKENLDRLLNRIQHLEELQKKDLFSNITEEIIAMRNEIIKHKNNITLLQMDQELVNKTYQESNEMFKKVVQELEESMKKGGTVSLIGLQMCDNISRIISAGADALVKSNSKLVANLKAINVDKDALSNALGESIDFLNTVDPYMGTTRVQNLKEALGVE